MALYKFRIIIIIIIIIIIKNSKYQKGDIAQQYIDTQAMSCCIISLFWYSLFFDV